MTGKDMASFYESIVFPVVLLSGIDFAHSVQKRNLS